MTRVLLIDDDKILGRTVGEILRDEGVNITVKENAKNIDRDLEDTKPEVIILDYMLGEEDGVEIARKLKKESKTKDIPIIMVSSSYGIEKLVRESGVEAFVPKPFNSDKLLTTIEKLTSKSTAKIDC